MKLSFLYRTIIFLLCESIQRGRKRRSSDCSEDGHHSDGDYSEHDYRGDPADEKESKTIMLRGLPVNITETDVSTKT